ncbi:MAG: carbon starvation CstA family protein [Gemmataceae bacterium]
MVFALALYHVEPNGRLVLHGLPVMLAVLAVLALAYRYYSAFLAARVAMLDDSRITPAHRMPDGQNYHATSRWVLFGHHFAAISGAGPLIGPVLAIQYGYMPGLLWLVIGVCLAGAVQDMLVLAASTRRDGKSLAEIARHELGRPAAVIASLAILVIIVIALAGLGIIVVKALGGENVKLPPGMTVQLPEQHSGFGIEPQEGGIALLRFPANCTIQYSPADPQTLRSEAFSIRTPKYDVAAGPRPKLTLGAGSIQVVPGSSWGTFTIACTIPIALFVGLYMQKLRPGRVLEASLLGGAMVLAATIFGAEIPGSVLEPFFALTQSSTVLALVIYGFIAAVLPVWLLLGPRDYLSSFLKIGTIVLLVGSVLLANPPLQAPMVNEVFINGGPTFSGFLFPYVFICVMCGSISGFHALVASGTTPKMVDRETDIRPIGYGAMLMESLVAVTALIAAASLPTELYYDINVPLDRAPEFQIPLADVQQKYGRDPLHALQVPGIAHLTLGDVEQQVGGESLRGRTGGAVTLAVGMSVIFESSFRTLGFQADWLLKYWYHFAIMFEALFILTTIDAGTRIGRFLLQETLGRVIPPFARQDWLPGALFASAVITGSWGWLIYTGSIDTIWPMFGVANQLLSVLALTLVTTWLVNRGRRAFALVTLLPMLFVATTTITAGAQLVTVRFPGLAKQGKPVAAFLNTGLTLFILCCVLALVAWAAARWVLVWRLGVPAPADSVKT